MTYPDRTDPTPAATWRRSSRCGHSGCVEARRTPTAVQIRDTAHPDTIVTIPLDDWATFAAGVKAGEFDDA